MSEKRIRHYPLIISNLLRELSSAPISQDLSGGDKSNTIEESLYMLSLIMTSWENIHHQRVVLPQLGWVLSMYTQLAVHILNTVFGFSPTYTTALLQTNYLFTLFFTSEFKCLSRGQLHVYSDRYVFLDILNKLFSDKKEELCLHRLYQWGRYAEQTPLRR